MKFMKSMRVLLLILCAGSLSLEAGGAKNVDLRPFLREHELYAKSQGSRPSCAVFSVVSALEYQLAQQEIYQGYLSEEFLIWATFEQLGRKKDIKEGKEIGFSLFSVLEALESYGIVPLEDMRNTNRNMAKIPDPSKEVLRKAKELKQGFITSQVQSDDPRTKIKQLQALLNRKQPALLALRWPHAKKLRYTNILDKQTPLPDSGHAVTCFGYKSDTGRLEDTKFLFKNSWGKSWGNAGYGYVTYDYLLEHLQQVVFFQVL